MARRSSRRFVKLFVIFISIGTALITGEILMARNDEQHPSQALHDVKQEPFPPLVPVLSPDYSFDGTRLLIGYGKNAYLWNVDTGKELQKFQGHEENVNAVALSPDRKHVLTGAGGGADMGIFSKDNSVRIWDIATGKEARRLEGHKALVHTVRYSPDGKRVLTASWGDATARLWDAATGRELFVFSDVYAMPPLSVSFSSDGRIIQGCAAGHRLRLWDAQTGKVLVTIERIKKGFFSSVEFDPSGTVILTALSDGTARTWDAKTGRPLKVFSGHTTKYVHQAIFTDDGRMIITAAADKTARLWNANTGAEIRQITYPGVVGKVLINRDGTRIFAQWENNDPYNVGVTLSDAESGREIRTFKCSEIVGFSPDGTKFPVVGDGKLVSLWDAKTGKMIREYKR